MAGRKVHARGGRSWRVLRVSGERMVQLEEVAKERGISVARLAEETFAKYFAEPAPLVAIRREELPARTPRLSERRRARREEGVPEVVKPIRSVPNPGVCKHGRPAAWCLDPACKGKS